MIKPRSFKILLLCALVALLVLNLYLLQQNHQYRHHNHSLILQNDSILSVNLELMHGMSNLNLQSTVQAGD